MISTPGMALMDQLDNEESISQRSLANAEADLESARAGSDSTVCRSCPATSTSSKASTSRNRGSRRAGFLDDSLEWDEYQRRFEPDIQDLREKVEVLRQHLARKTLTHKWWREAEEDDDEDEGGGDLDR